MSNFSFDEFFNDTSFDDYKIQPGLVYLPYELVTRTVQVEARAMHATYTREHAEVLTTRYGIDIADELTNVLQQELRNAIDEEL